MNRQKFDIAIVGSSFAGMTCALTLAQISPQISIALIEKENIFEKVRGDDGRAYAISSSSLKLFKELGIYDELQNVAGKIADIKITDYKSPFVLDFIGAEVDEKDGQLGQIIENHFIFEALKNKISQQKNITIFCPNFYQEINFDDNVVIELNDKKFIEAKLFLACDGRFSKLRELYEIPTQTKNYHQTAIVFKISHKIPHQNIAYEKFLPSGPLAILPLKDQN
jgi:2-octaprenyl-6-methoxyphenol hydroxylase